MTAKMPRNRGIATGKHCNQGSFACTQYEKNDKTKQTVAFFWEGKVYIDIVRSLIVAIRLFNKKR